MSQASLKALTERKMPTTAEVHRKTSTTDGRLGSTTTFPFHVTTKCRLVHKSSTTLDENRKVVVKNHANIYMPLGTDVIVTDQLWVGSRKYEIQGLSTEQSFGVQLTATCVEVR